MDARQFDQLSKTVASRASRVGRSEHLCHGHRFCGAAPPGCGGARPGLRGVGSGLTGEARGFCLAQCSGGRGVCAIEICLPGETWDFNACRCRPDH